MTLKNYLKKQRKNLKYRSDSLKTYQSHNVHLRNMRTSYKPDCTVFGNLSVDSGNRILEKVREYAGRGIMDGAEATV